MLATVGRERTGATPRVVFFAQPARRSVVISRTMNVRTQNNSNVLRFKRRADSTKQSRKVSSRIFFLTFIAKEFIYGSHCDLFKVANLMFRENQSMKNATKKAAKAPAKKKAAPKKKK